MGEPRKVLDAQFVGETNAAAMKALGDVKARDKWASSKAGSPITTNMLCAEIARLNIAQEALVQALEPLLNVVDETRGTPDEEPKEPCTELCGNSWCNEFGCIPQKKRDARAAIKLAKGAT